MRSALVPQRAVASDPVWREFLEDLQRTLWAETEDGPSAGRPTEPARREEDRP